MRLKWLAFIAFVLLAVSLLWDEKSEATGKSKATKISQSVETVRSVSPVQARRNDSVEAPLAAEVTAKYSVFPPKYVAASVPPQIRPDADPFGTRVWVPRAPAIPKPVAQTPMVSQPSLPPVRTEAPASGLEFVGAMDAPAGGQLVFLARGLEQYSLRVGDTVDGAWRLSEFTNDRLVLKHLASGQEQVLARFAETNTSRSFPR